ncbi:SufD family Fe-S cluster assembly protein [Rhodoferax sp. UBA5149]|uniref:SufD family Fe-S cluster assembly protein n=1 Tax=Rhodoferax sp. UBA5149 TaxID=1947379 RepID=UPI002600413A|nr:SufD family Fe-S cluster assembly protein [Rhodoferax sp. UBA5149]
MTRNPCPDATAARQRLASHGWIDRKAENFRHLPPPALAVWLPDTSVASAPTVGWSVQALDPAQKNQFQAQWLNPAEPEQRSALYEGLPWPDEGDAAHFGWVHRATCQRGLRLHIGEPLATRPASQQTIQLVLRMQPAALFDAPLLVIDVAAGVHCVLLERHDFDTTRAAGVQNLDLHIRLGRGAHLQHLRAVSPAPADRLAHQIHVQLAQDAHYDQVLLASGSAYHLQRTQVDLSQPGSQARLGSALLVADATLDQQVELSHGAAHTHSAVEALVLASGKALAVVNAHTRIASGADEAAVRQRLSAIPTSGQPRVVLRPHMEIHHDQVQAAHGATFGALPEDALFYARQRGLDEASALALILEGLQRAVLERALDDPEILQTMQLDALLARMTRQHLAQVQP